MATKGDLISKALTAAERSKVPYKTWFLPSGFAAACATARTATSVHGIKERQTYLDIVKCTNERVSTARGIKAKVPDVLITLFPKCMAVPVM